MLKYQNVHRKIPIYIYININIATICKTDAIDYKVCGVLSVGIDTLLHPSYVGL